MEKDIVYNSNSEINNQTANDCLKELLKKNPWEIDDREELFLKIKSKQNNKKNKNDSDGWNLFGKTMGL